jgi:hypothetical protein
MSTETNMNLLKAAIFELLAGQGYANQTQIEEYRDRFTQAAKQELGTGHFNRRFAAATRKTQKEFGAELSGIKESAEAAHARAKELNLFVVPGMAYPDYTEYLCEDEAGYATTNRDWTLKLYPNGDLTCECEQLICVHYYSVELYLKRTATSSTEVTEDQFATRLSA